jgi:hypothetical protein
MFPAGFRGIHGTLTERGTIIWGGKEYEMFRSPILLPDENEPRMGIVVNMASVECPLPEARGKCSATYGIDIEVYPRAWLCPQCNGLIMADSRHKSNKYKKCDYFSPINDDLALYFYSSYRLPDGFTLSEWLEKRTGSKWLSSPIRLNVGDLLKDHPIRIKSQFMPIDQEWLNCQKNASD